MTTPTLRPLRTYEPIRGQILPLTRRPTPPVAAPVVQPIGGPFREMITRILEAHDGRRPLTQLLSFVAEPVYEATRTRLRTTPPNGTRHTLRSAHTCHPAKDVAEFCGLVEIVRGGRTESRRQAVVARFEHGDGKWRCVYFRVVR